MRKMKKNIYCKLTKESIDYEKYIKKINKPDCGAITVFIGVVRNYNKSRKVKAIEYTAYKKMAEIKLKEIVDEIVKKIKYNINICVIHRIGYLKVKEASLFIGVSTGHREEAYKINREIIEQIKKRVPIWKKEFFI